MPLPPAGNTAAAAPTARAPSGWGAVGRWPPPPPRLGEAALAEGASEVSRGRKCWWGGTAGAASPRSCCSRLLLRYTSCRQAEGEAVVCVIDSTTGGAGWLCSWAPRAHRQLQTCRQTAFNAGAPMGTHPGINTTHTAPNVTKLHSQPPPQHPANTGLPGSVDPGVCSLQQPPQLSHRLPHQGRVGHHGSGVQGAGVGSHSLGRHPDPLVAAAAGRGRGGCRQVSGRADSGPAGRQAAPLPLTDPEGIEIKGTRRRAQQAHRSVAPACARTSSGPASSASSVRRRKSGEMRTRARARGSRLSSRPLRYWITGSDSMPAALAALHSPLSLAPMCSARSMAAAGVAGWLGGLEAG